MYRIKNKRQTVVIMRARRLVAIIIVVLRARRPVIICAHQMGLQTKGGGGV
jgi:hypothetical protein